MGLSLDIRQGIRSLQRHRVLALTATVTLGLGIGAALTMAGIVDRVLLRPHPVRDQDRVVVAWGVFESSRFGHVPFSAPILTAIAERTRVFEQVAGVDYNGSWPAIARIDDRTTTVRLSSVGGDFFATLGVAPVIGRMLTAADDRRGAAPVIVISRGLWQRRFGGDTTVIGRAMPLWTRNYTIIGVAPHDLGMPQGVEAWVPFAAINPDAAADPDYGVFDLVGRLRPGRTLEDARVELGRLWLESSPGSWGADSRLIATTRSLQDHLVGPVRPAVLVLWSAAVLVFLVAVLNLGNLLVVRGVERQQEFAVRRAIGASRWSLARQIVAESVVLVALGGAMGVAVAWAAWSVIPALAPADFPRMDEISLRPGVFLFAFGLSLIAVALTSALPAVALRETDLRLPRGIGAGPGDSPSRTRAWTFAVAAQVSLAVVTLVAAVLLIRTLLNLQRLQPGYEVDGLSVMQVAMLDPEVETSEQVIALMDRALEPMGAVPGVEAVSAILGLPFSGTAGYDFGFAKEGQSLTEAAANPYLNFEAVTPDYFATLQTPILRGRGFTKADRAGAPLVVVVSRTMAGHLWPGEDPLGKRIRWADSASINEWRTVVGVAADTRYRDLVELRPTVYVPMSQQYYSPSYLLIRATRPLAGLAPALRQAAQQVVPGLDLLNPMTMEELMGRPLARPRFNAGALAVFSASAVLLTALGLYGLTSFVIAQRRREIGIRLALGADSGRIVRLFLKRGLLPVAAGAVVGVLVALAGGKALESLVYGVRTSDSATIAAAVLGLMVVALAAILIATRAASRTDPSAALRAE